MRLFYFTSGPRERVFDAVLDAGHEVAALYVTDPARWPKVAPTVQRAEARRIPVRIVGRRDLEGPVGELRGAVCLSVGFGLIFPARFLSAVGACLNVHGTLLPKYAGARTLNWVIACGERESGVTVHLVDEGVDTGPVLLQRMFPLSPYETGRSLARKTLEFEPPVVVEALSLFARNGVVVARAQDTTEVTRFPDRRPEHSELDPRQPLAMLYDQIRAADAERYPAYFYVNGEKVCVRLWRPDKSDDEHDLV
ncbi:MAG TPA: formyltransferase family protein [Stellaceae bacterium]|nr:formyltransferase family protein [Stellaceae bacterium]